MGRARESTTTTLRAGLLAFLVAAVTLFSQVLIHRSVSAKLLSNYAFLVISLTMLGFALSGVILTRWLEPFSVLAPVLSVALSMTAGISALMLAAVPVYLVVGFALPAPGAAEGAESP